jgi:hypothetical protein
VVVAAVHVPLHVTVQLALHSKSHVQPVLQLHALPPVRQLVFEQVHPVGHAHMPSAQESPAPQDVAQSPHVVGLARSASQPSASIPLQSSKPRSHASTMQLPPAHVEEA